MRVTVVGAGYVGLTTGTALAYMGHRVTAVDRDSSKIQALNEGRATIHERGLDSLLRLTRDTMHFATRTQSSVSEADVIIIAVGTPPKANGQADIQHVEAAATEVAAGLLPGKNYTVVVKSTVPIGTGRRVASAVNRVLSAHARGCTPTVDFAANPEFLREGNALHDTFFPDRIVVGTSAERALAALKTMYQPILEQTFTPPPGMERPVGYCPPSLLVTDPASAEMIKFASNAFLSLKISFINEVAGLCERVGADAVEVARGMGLDKRIGTGFLEAGLGWGGSCFPKDTAALMAMAREFGYELPLVRAAREVNLQQRRIVVEKLQGILKGLRGRTVGVLGLTFKPGTDDVRESPSVDVVRLLLEREAHVRVHDPIVGPSARDIVDASVEVCQDVYGLAEGADGLILATAWDDYKKLDLVRIAKAMRSPVFVDGRNVFEPGRAREAGLIYEGIGR